MSTFIDRRLNPGGKSLGNRQRFVRRAKEHLKDIVKKQLTDSNVTDFVTTGGRKIKFSGKSLAEPTLRRSREVYDRDHVVPGNDEHVSGDIIEKPDEDGGQGTAAGDGPDGSEDFYFTLTRDELIDVLFDDMELPDLVKQSLKDLSVKKYTRTGTTTTGSPSNLDLIKTMRNSIGRRIALRRPSDDEMDDAEAQMARADGDPELVAEAQARIDELNSRRSWIPFVDPIDVRFRAYEPRPQPTTQAVMFCLMDVSGSMGEREKDLAKRFFLLLHLFLTSRYERVKVVFIRHTTEAEEVDERTFFYDPKSGGTVVRSALDELIRIQRERFDTALWNVYVAQASDGDSSATDAVECAGLLKSTILPFTQHYSYVEIGRQMHDPMSIYGLIAAGLNGSSYLWNAYKKVDDSTLACAKVMDQTQVYPVFRELFKKR